MKNIAFILLIVFSATIISCEKDKKEEEKETSTILAGYIKDSRTNEPIEGARVTLNIDEYTALTDENGYYLIENLTNFAYMDAVEAFNYASPFTTNVSMSETEDTTWKNYFLDELQPSITFSTGSIMVGTQDSEPFVIYNNGPGAYLHYEIITEKSYIIATPSQGTIISGDIEQIVISIDRTGLAAGNYTSTVFVNSNARNVELNLSYTVE